MSRIKLTRNDTPQIKVVINDEITGAPMDISGGTVKLRIRAIGSSATLLTLSGVLLAGLEQDDGSLNYTYPYSVVGSGGRVAFQFAVGQLSIPAGQYEGEVETTTSTGHIITAQNLIKLQVREEFAS